MFLYTAQVLEDLSSLIRDGTRASCSGSARESPKFGVLERKGAGDTTKRGQNPQIHLEV